MSAGPRARGRGTRGATRDDLPRTEVVRTAYGAYYSPHSHAGGGMSMRVAVAGASGYVGGELLRLIAAHPHLKLVAATAHGRVGARVSEVHPHLVSHADLVFDVADPAALAEA